MKGQTADIDLRQYKNQRWQPKIS